MFIDKHTEGVQVAQATSADTLTDEDVWRLTMIQQRCGYQPLLLELGLDIRRLEFARWLVERGIVNEGQETAHTDSATAESCGVVARS
ncbi:MAG: hypothetical protein ACXVCO_09535 [Ktedonobacterales bacterium]